MEASLGAWRMAAERGLMERGRTSVEQGRGKLIQVDHARGGGARGWDKRAVRWCLGPLVVGACWRCRAGFLLLEQQCHSIPADDGHSSHTARHAHTA